MELNKVITKLEKSKIKAGDGKNNGNYPLFTCSPTVNKYYDEFLYDTEVIILSTGGNPVINYYNGKFAYSTDCLAIKTNNEIKEKYLYYYLISRINKIEKMFRGVGIKHLNKKEFFKLEIEFPQIEAQEIVVEELDNLQSIIDIRKKQIQQFDELIKSQFVEMFENKNFNQIVSVEDVCTEMKIGPFGSALHKDEISASGEIFVLGTDNAVDNEFKIYEKRFISNEKYQELVKYTVHPKDIIISMMGTIGRTAMIPTDFCKAIISSHLCYLTANNEFILPEFLQQTFKLNDYIDYQINKHKKGAIMNGLNLKIIKSLEFDLPPIELQRQFIEFVKQIDKQKFEIQKSIDEMQNLYESLIDQYFG